MPGLPDVCTGRAELATGSRFVRGLGDLDRIGGWSPRVLIGRRGPPETRCPA
ncbi:MAG: hypothetical protein ACRDTC_05885 [Pseudonocardiaceae bacterium]